MQDFFRWLMPKPVWLELSFEETRKRKVYAATVVPGVAIMLSFGLYHLFCANLLEGFLDVMGGLWMLGSIFLLRITKKGLPIFRANALLLGLVFLFLAAKGGPGGNKLLWMFSFPLVALYTLGLPEGLLWIGAVLAVNLMILFLPLDTPWIHAYGKDYKIRFCAAYLLVVAMTFVYENERRKSQANLENERNDLEREKKERKELEARLVRSQKMEALGLLAGGVAHDLNNVLSAIVGYPDILLMRLPEDSDLRRPLNVMRASGLKAAAIVQDLLTLARRGVTNFDVLDLNALVGEYLHSPELEKLKACHPKVEIRTDLQADLRNIKGSAIHLKKSLMNLVSNAAEALPDGGLVEIKTQNMTVDRQCEKHRDMAEGDYVVLHVADNGISIDKEDLEKIFEPFYTKKKMGHSGTGLGLAVVWGTVQDHQGYIHVNSEITQGTLMTLYFPATEDCLGLSDENISLNDYRGNGERILVVDDMLAQREITSEMLTALGYRVASLASGEEAVAFMRENKADIVILDMIMDPGIDGLETYARLRAVQPDIKTLLVSGYSETGRVKNAQRLGAGGYVKKPFSIETIGLAVQKELKRTVSSSGEPGCY